MPLIYSMTLTRRRTFVHTRRRYLIIIVTQNWCEGPHHETSRIRRESSNVAWYQLGPKAKWRKRLMKIDPKLADTLIILSYSQYSKIPCPIIPAAYTRQPCDKKQNKQTAQPYDRSGTLGSNLRCYYAGVKIDIWVETYHRTAWDALVPGGLIFLVGPPPQYTGCNPIY